MTKGIGFFRAAAWLLAVGFGLWNVAQVDELWAGDSEVYTQKLSQSTTGYDFWTTPPSEKVFKDKGWKLVK